MDGGQRQATARVNVTVLDVNDNAPQFAPDMPTRVAIRDGAPAGTVLANITAIDADAGENGRVVYALRTHSDLFHVATDGGELITLKPLTIADGGDQFVLEVIAKDLGRPPRYSSVNVTVELAADASRPRFREKVYHTEIAPGRQTNGSQILQVTAGVGPYSYLLDSEY